MSLETKARDQYLVFSVTVYRYKNCTVKNGNRENIDSFEICVGGELYESPGQPEDEQVDP